MNNKELARRLAEQAKRGAAYTQEGLADIFTGMLNRHCGLNFRELALINLQRAQRWHKRGGIAEWNAAEWSNAMAGEAGEACNATKKLRRIECAMQQADGDTPAPKTIDQAVQKILKEVGDTVIYADLLCQRVGGTMEDAVRLAFNSVSDREGFPEKI